MALTFFILFLGRGTAEAALEVVPVLGSEGPALTAEAQELADLQSELTRLRNSLASMFDWSRHERLYLLIASVIGTLFWTFGDLIAKAFGAASGCA